MTDSTQIDDAQKQLGLSEISWFIQTFWRQILICGILAGIFGAFFSHLLPRTYTATAAVIYEPTAGPTLSSSARWLESSLETNMRIESQVEIVLSSSVAEDVVRQASLYKDPEFEKPMSLRNRLLNALYPIGSSNAKPSSPATLPQPAQPEEIPQAQIDKAVPNLLSRLTARRVGRSTVIAISMHAGTPEKATRLANIVAQSYIDADLRRKSTAMRRGSLWLQERLEQLRRQSFDATQDVENFRRSASSSISDAVVRLAELESIALTYRRMYENILLQLTDTEQKVSYPVPDVRVLSPATLSRVTQSPKTSLIVAFMTLLGMLGGIAYALYQLSREHWFHPEPVPAQSDTAIANYAGRSVHGTGKQHGTGRPAFPANPAAPRTSRRDA
ncbi:MAG: hypothetical protein RLZ98_1282 [Pseudomonadota bacterium]|jgi:uncharacterized protein involved in exopolysaccharide biosynthesis